MSRGTIIFHYGAGQNLATPQVFDIVTSYLNNQEFNFIMVDYDSINIVNENVCKIKSIRGFKLI